MNLGVTASVPQTEGSLLQEGRSKLGFRKGQLCIWREEAEGQVKVQVRKRWFSWRDWLGSASGLELVSWALSCAPGFSSSSPYPLPGVWCTLLLAPHQARLLRARSVRQPPCGAPAGKRARASGSQASIASLQAGCVQILSRARSVVGTGGPLVTVGHGWWGRSERAGTSPLLAPNPHPCRLRGQFTFPGLPFSALPFPASRT